MALLVFAHIDPDQVLLGIEESFRKSFRKLRFPDAGRTKKDERADRSPRVLNSRASPYYRISHQLHRLILPYNALVKHFIEPEQLFPLSFNEPGHRDSGPARHNVGYFLLGNHLTEEPRSLLPV